MGERVLVVDDEPDVLRLLGFNLEQAGFDVECVGTAAEALIAAGKRPPAVVVLDLMLPDISGIDVCKNLRADENLRDLGVLMLTARGDDDDRITGLEAGADDYVVKPFNVREVVLRVTALSRRVGERREARDATPEKADSKLVSGKLELDTRTHAVTWDGAPLELRPLEFKLLATLMAEPGRVFTREQLMLTVWEMPNPLNPRTVDVHVRRLRKNLGAGADVIETVPGFGYRARE